MIQYNYININYQAGMDGLKYANSKGLPVFIMEPLLGGRLADGLPKKASEIFKSVNPNYSNVGWALRWIWNQPEVTLVLSGMNGMVQINENVSLADGSSPSMLTETELTAYDDVITAFNECYKVQCTGCNYCMPCPKNVNIPACFAAYNASYAISRRTGVQQYFTGASFASAKENQGLASQCVGCGKCEQHCPQGIKIRDELKNVEKRLEPFLVKASAWIVGQFMS